MYDIQCMYTHPQLGQRRHDLLRSVRELWQTDHTNTALKSRAFISQHTKSQHTKSQRRAKTRVPVQPAIYALSSRCMPTSFPVRRRDMYMHQQRHLFSTDEFWIASNTCHKVSGWLVELATKGEGAPDRGGRRCRWCEALLPSHPYIFSSGVIPSAFSALFIVWRAESNNKSRAWK